MALVQNVPFFSIMLSMFSGIVSAILPEKWAKRLNAAMICVVGGMSAWLLLFMINSRIGHYTYMMGHFPAPWAMNCGSASWRQAWPCSSASLCC